MNPKTDSNRLVLPNTNAGGVHCTVESEGRFGYLSEEAKVAAASSLLLGAMLRDWLTDQESAFLDLLPPPGHQFFLVRQSCFLHPDKPPFPIDIIESSAALDGNAIFSHRHELESRGSSGACNVRTATIQTEPGEEFVIGLYGPVDPVTRDKIDNCFSSLVRLFRHAVSSANETYLTLQEKLNTNEAHLLVNRASGCIVHANGAAGTMLSTELRSLIGQEYGQTTDQVIASGHHPAMTLENLTSGGMSLSLVRLTPSAVDAMPSVETNQDSSKDHLRSSLATIVTAASVLESSCQTLSPEETREITDIILGEAYDMDRHFNIEMMYRKFAHQVRRRVNLQYEAENAIIRFTDTNRFTDEVKLIVTSPVPYTTAPGDIYAHLFESILAIHFRATGQTSQIQISIHLAKDSRDQVVNVTTRTGGSLVRIVRNEGLPRDIHRLATQLGVELQTKINDKHDSIETTIIIPAQETIAK
ncbi:MAG: hypothetical protein KOO62_11710 [candidate division Zixibacteria bacterium]|nr:hypothetical protein [candidate division Zixibacteria bacterium]